MQRIPIEARPDWQSKVEQLGLVWHTVENGNPYWNESAYYSFSNAEAKEIETASARVYKMFLEAGQYVIDNDLFGKFGIPAWAIPFIKRAWNEEPPALNHGRFDLGYDGKSPPKLFEYNCDTPTSMFEAAVVQWNWKQTVLPQKGQFNSIHEWLVWKWEDLKPYLENRLVHFTHANDAAGEDTLTVTYLRDTALKVGIKSEPIVINDIGWDTARKRFVDLQDRPIDILFHLYPWEWLANESYATHIAECYDSMLWIEPIWKMMWSNKAILAVLWEMYPNHPNLLPAYFEPQGTSYVKKPLLAREGANITVVKDGQELVTTDGDYGTEGFIYQGLYDLPNFDGNYPVIGSWMVDGNAAGMGIREGGLVTGNMGRFVPHVVER